jgi:hypothetical protein
MSFLCEARGSCETADSEAWFAERAPEVPFPMSQKQLCGNSLMQYGRRKILGVLRFVLGRKLPA